MLRSKIRLCFAVLAVGATLSVAGCSRQKQPPAAAQPTPAQRAELAVQGKLIFDQTPQHAAAYVGNKLSCGDCHVDSGKAPYAAPLINITNLFPMYTKRAGRVISMQERINECFVRSENGKPLPNDSPEMVALVAYLDSLSSGVKGQAYPQRGFVQVPALTGNPVRGKQVYATQCAVCHGVNGEGVPPVLPPVWGPDSYNDGAGMDHIQKMAAFLVHNMPQNHPGTLKPQEAFDVAAFIHSKPRPAFNPKYKGL
jgi:thiosulfate dehydrogenase